MEFTAIVAALLRRWYIVLAGLALTAGLVYVANDAVPPTYSATGSVLLLPPGASVADGSNPLLALGGLEQPAALVVAYLAGDESRQLFAEDFPNTTYDIVLDPLSRGPLVLIKVEDPSEDDVMSALDAVLDTLPDALSMLQDQVDAPADSRVTSMPLSVDTRPTTERSDSLRALIAAAGVGLVLTLVGAVAFDALAARRRAKGVAAETEEPKDAAPTATQHDEPEHAVAEPPADPAVTEATWADAAEPATGDVGNGADPEPWGADASTVQARDFVRPEERYGSQWPPPSTQASPVGDEHPFVFRA